MRVIHRTLCLQNKKKSKKVQAFVQSVAKQVKDNVDRHFDAAKSAEAKRAEDLRKQKAQQAQIEKEMGSFSFCGRRAVSMSLVNQPALRCRLTHFHIRCPSLTYALQLRCCAGPSSSPSWTLEWTPSPCYASSSRPAAARR